MTASVRLLALSSALLEITHAGLITLHCVVVIIRILGACGLLGMKERDTAAVSGTATEHRACGQIWAAAQE